MSTEISSVEFSLLKKFLAGLSGIEVPDNKQYLFTTRLGEFLKRKKFGSFAQLYNQLVSGDDKALQREFVQSMTTHESSFYRDSRPFRVLEKHLLPHVALYNHRNARYLRPGIRILSVGCSHGQEPYTIAMCARNWLATQDRYKEEDVSIMAVDISQRVLNHARKGVYTDIEIGTTLPAAMRTAYLSKLPDGNSLVKDDVRAMVKFSEHNLVEPITDLGKYDIIFCRNVIIYFPLDLKIKILKRLHRQLTAHGALILGASETTYNLSDDFEVVQRENTAYFVPVKSKSS